MKVKIQDSESHKEAGQINDLSIMTWGLKTRFVRPEETAFAMERLVNSFPLKGIFKRTTERLQEDVFSTRLLSRLYKLNHLENCSACKTRFSSPLEIFQGALRSTSCTRVLTIYIRLCSKTVHATSNNHRKSLE